MLHSSLLYLQRNFILNCCHDLCATNFSVKKAVFELSRVCPWRWPRGGTTYMELIGPVFHNTFKTCLKRVGHGGYEWVEKEMFRFAEDMSKQTHRIYGVYPIKTIPACLDKCIMGRLNVATHEMYATRRHLFLSISVSNCLPAVKSICSRCGRSSATIVRCTIPLVLLARGQRTDRNMFLLQ